MSEEKKNIFIGVAWPYASGKTHIGNVTGSFFPADVLFRFHKLLGHKVLMVSGSDCFGTPITIKAEEEGIKPNELADKYHDINLEILKKMNISIVSPEELKNEKPFSKGLFTKTSTENHKLVVQKFFLKLLENGYITRKKSKQLYDPILGKFMQDRYIEGTCPYCGYEKARGDQCENCGKVLEPNQLINPKSKNSGNALEEKETEHYFIDLERLSPDIEKFLESEEFVKNSASWVQKEALGWVKDGLRQRAITRDMDYGISLPVNDIPENERIANIENKVFYVWFDAVIGYLSASFEYTALLGEDLEYKDDDVLLPTTRSIDEFFYGKNVKSYYVVGQDNIVFHAINWPAQLIAYNKYMKLPDVVQAQKFLQLEGKKISKSDNWFIEWEDIFDNFDIDLVRFYLAHNLPQTNQTSWQWEEFQNIINGILVAKIGNFIHRILTFTHKNFGNYLDESKLDNLFWRDNIGNDIKNVMEHDIKYFSMIDNYKTIEKFNKQNGQFIRGFVLNIISYANQCNSYVDNNKFWELAKTDENRCKEVLYNCLNLVNIFRYILYPICPDASDKISKLLSLPNINSEIGIGDDLLSEFREIPSEYKIVEDIKPIFKKIEDEDIEKFTKD